MRRLQEELIREHAIFVKKIRRMSILLMIVMLGVLGLLAYSLFRLASAGGADPVHAGPTESQRQAPSLAEMRNESDRSRLVPLEAFEPEHTPVVVQLAEPEAREISVIQEAVLLKVLEAVSSLSQQELVQRADTTVRWEDFADKERQEALRGRVCRFRGTLRRIEENRDIDLSSIGIESLYEGQVQDHAGRWYSLYCFQKPAQDMTRNDVAELVGVYYGLITFPTRGGKESVTPLVVARTVTAVPQVARPRSQAAALVERAPVWALYVGAAVVVVLICLAGSLLLRQPPPVNHVHPSWPHERPSA